MRLTKMEKAAVAVLFASGEPIPVSRLAQVFDCDDAAAHWMMRRVMDYFDEEESPLQVLRLDDQYQMSTREEFQEAVKKALEIKKSQPLSQAAMEVLAIVAYNQPVTRAYVEQVRRVDSTRPITVLLDRELIEERGRLDVIGRPRLFGTTQNFLKTFGISSLAELPSLDLFNIDTDNS